MCVLQQVRVRATDGKERVMIKRYCDRCGKEIKPDKDITKPFIWWTITMHAMADTSVDMCHKCYEKINSRAEADNAPRSKANG